MVQVNHLRPQDPDHISKLVLICHESPCKERERVLEELVVVSPVKHRWLHVAYQVLEE